MRDVSAGCARARSGQAAAKPTIPLTKSRRRIAFLKPQDTTPNLACKSNQEFATSGIGFNDRRAQGSRCAHTMSAARAGGISCTKSVSHLAHQCKRESLSRGTVSLATCCCPVVSRERGCHGLLHCCCPRLFQSRDYRLFLGLVSNPLGLRYSLRWSSRSSLANRFSFALEPYSCVTLPFLFIIM